jgi:hypothetical protein
MRRVISILLVIALMVAMLAVGPAAMAKKGNGHGKGQAKKVTICHNGHTIKVSKKAAASHLKHHPLDYAGPCLLM